MNYNNCPAPDCKGDISHITMKLKKENENKYITCPHCERVIEIKGENHKTSNN